MSKCWDNATLKKLKALMGKGLSTSEIGRRLGLSKNAVVGKLNRLGWNSKAGGVASGDKGGKSGDAKKTARSSATAKTTAKAGTTKKATARDGKKATATSRSGGRVAGAKKSGDGAVAGEKKPSGTRNLNKNLAMHQRIIQHSLELANLKPNQCRWPIGDPDSENFHFCGAQVFVGKPYCYEHCKQAYQFTPPKKK